MATGYRLYSLGARYGNARDAMTILPAYRTLRIEGTTAVWKVVR